MSVDAHYTPDWLADRVASLLPGSLVGVVADFTAGEGALLDAVERRFWGRCTYLATDVDAHAVRSMARNHPDWLTGSLDLLSRRSRESNEHWRTFAGTVSAVVLNPPFSYRGGGPIDRIGAEKTRRPSPAMLCLTSSLEALEHGGVAVAILPANSLRSERDSVAWASLRGQNVVEVVGHMEPGAFPLARARTALVRIAKGASLGVLDEVPKARAERLAPDGDMRCVEVVRGRVQVHTVTELRGRDAVPFIHTTELRGEQLLHSGIRARQEDATSGPFVLVPRVGKPLASKVVVVQSSETLVLSDCVYALRPVGATCVGSVGELLRERFEEFKDLYSGSCAPYLTVSTLIDWLGKVGWHAQAAPASAAPRVSCRLCEDDLRT